MEQFIFDTTGVISPVKFEELGAYFDHPTSAYTLSNHFSIEEIRDAATIQDAIDNNYITAYDESGNTITSLTYIDGQIPVFEIDSFSSSISYIGYGTASACKIQKVETSTDGTYTSLWSSGNESFDKIWANRYSYSYF